MAGVSNQINVINTVLKKVSAEKLFLLLNSIKGEKDLVLDKELICSLDNIVENFSQLKACKVDKVFKLEPGAAPGKSIKCVYLIKPTIQNAQIIADHINACKSVEGNKHFWIINVPRKLFGSELVLEREGVYGYITHMEMPLGFISIDADILSLEIPDFFEKFYLHGNLIYVHTAAMALVQLYKICGPIPKTFGQGKCSKMVLDLMKDIVSETVPEFKAVGEVSHLVIVDRDIDYVPLLLSQLTYEGMLDEFFTINNGKIVFPKEVTGKDEPLKVILNRNDVVYEAIRNKYFASVFGFLRDKAKELQSKSETSSMSIGQIKNLVANELKSIQKQHAALSLHIGACELIFKQKSEENFQDRLQIELDILEGTNLKDCITYIQDCIGKMEPYSSVLRLMCLLSIAQDGLLSSDYLTLCTDFRQTYGCAFVPMIYRLGKMGLLTEHGSLLSSDPSRSSRLSNVASAKASQIAEKVVTAVSFKKYNSFRQLTRKFNLIPAKLNPEDLKDPKDMSYVFAGSYVPLIGRITEQIVVHGDLKNLEDSMKLLPGSTIINFKSNKGAGYELPSKSLHLKTVMVYILGGITYAEIAALRLIGKLHGCRILIATTSIVSGNSIMKMFEPKCESEE